MVQRALLAVLLALASLPIIAAQPPAKIEVISIPAGTVLHCRVAETITTKLNSQGDPFAATVAEPVMLDGREVIPAGATLRGHITEMEKPGRIKGVGQMRLAVDQIALPDGRTFPLAAVLMTAYGVDNVKVVGSEGLVKGPSSRGPDLKEIGAGTGGGTFLGLVLGHPLLGATFGATATTIDRLRRRGKDLTIPVGTQLNYQLTHAIELTHVATQAEAVRPAHGASH